MKTLTYVLQWMLSVGAVAFIFIFIDYVASFGAILFAIYVAWVLAPIKHPADYYSYRSWWADRKNWFKR